MVASAAGQQCASQFFFHYQRAEWSSVSYMKQTKNSGTCMQQCVICNGECCILSCVCVFIWMMWPSFVMCVCGFFSFFKQCHSHQKCIRREYVWWPRLWMCGAARLELRCTLYSCVVFRKIALIILGEQEVLANEHASTIRTRKTLENRLTTSLVLFV